MSAANPLTVQIVFDPLGMGHCLYDEMFDLRQLGELHIQRGSHVEPDATGRWIADMAPVGGPVLGPFARRSVAIEAERTWLVVFWLQRDRQPSGAAAH